MSNPDIRGPAVAFKKMMPSHFHHNLGNINKKEPPCCNHQSGCDSQKATDCELLHHFPKFQDLCSKKSSSQTLHIALNRSQNGISNFVEESYAL